LSFLAPPHLYTTIYIHRKTTASPSANPLSSPQQAGGYPAGGLMTKRNKRTAFSGGSFIYLVEVRAGERPYPAYHYIQPLSGGFYL
jgi:hypothetical protein